ncbi:MAG: hypothetical protein IKE58_07420 [Blautia sp.]|nr:hypothetical protein [Blautia sp.]
MKIIRQDPPGGNFRNPAARFFLLCFLVYFGRNERSSSRLVYLTAGGLALAAYLWNQRNPARKALEKRKGKVRKDLWPDIARWVASTLFGLIVVGANYRMYMDDTPGHKAITMLLLGAGGFTAASEGLKYAAVRMKRKQTARIQWSQAFPWKAFLACFLLMAGLNLFLLFACVYPGNICSDSLSQIKQILYGNYSNHHPFYHTMLIRVFFTLGMNLFHDINAAVACFHLFEILLLAAVFALVVATMLQAGCRKLTAVFVFLWYWLMPFHISFSFTMWKDTVYGAVICLFTVSLYRCVKESSHYRLVNIILLAVSALGFCILRSNGMPAFVFFLLCFILMEGKKHFNIVLILVWILMLSLVLKYPVLKSLNVAQPDTVESLSIPLQQMARVAYEDGSFTQSERDYLEQVVSIRRMKEEYHPDVSDYIKNLIRYEGHQEVITLNQNAFLATWASVVFHHPVLALRAWIDQTYGYWNPCPSYWMLWMDGLYEEEGLKQTIYWEKGNELYHHYVGAFMSDNLVLRQAYNVGLHSWILFFFLALAAMKKKKEALIALPVVGLLLTLMIATPMCYEFRYAYPLYATLPIIIFALVEEKS